eukprot:m.242896 g.242896  ORF g.242896 m.242896 type:complete len:206 (+) comp40229_c2_seq21:1637-2254(+)
MAQSSRPQPAYDYFLVLGFEATCDDLSSIEPMEIIEFAVVLLNSKTLKTEDTFHFYVQPTVNPNLTRFCIKLTGIAQNKVDGQPKLPEVMKKFDKWLKKHKLLRSESKVCFVTCGDWDLKTALPDQCKHLGLPVQSYFQKWVNIKKAFQATFSLVRLPRDIREMLGYLKMTFDGRPHCGLDDATNLARILVELLKIKPELKETTS